MRFLVDQCLSPEFARKLSDAGHDVVHLRELGLERAPDPEVLDVARSQGRVLVSADTDFGTLLARSSATGPSVVMFRRATGRRPAAQAVLLIDNLPAISEALETGSVVVLEETRLRLRRLPLVE